MLIFQSARLKISLHVWRLSVCSLLCLGFFLSPLWGHAEELQKSTPQPRTPNLLKNKKILPEPQDASLELMAGQMIMVGFRGERLENNRINYHLKSIDPKNPARGGIDLGGVILFDVDVYLVNSKRNVISPEQVASLNADLQAASAYPLFIGIDQEGGKVRRLKDKLGFLPLPSARQMGKEDNETTLKRATALGQELQRLHINIDFAPVADVDLNPNSPAIGKLERSFSSDPELVTEKCSLFLKGLAASNIIGSLKHFPGHGSASDDTHAGLADISASWQKDIELAPYRELIKRGQVDIVMVGHIANQSLDKGLPASLSPATIKGLLREELGFDGLVITDDLQMGAIASHYSLQETVRLAINAGVDILLFGNNLTLVHDPDIARKVRDIILDLVAKGKISREQLEASYTRIKKLKDKMPAE